MLLRVVVPALLLLWPVMPFPSNAVTFLVTTEDELYETVTLLESGQNIFIDIESVQLHKRLNITASRVKIMGRSDGTTLHCPKEGGIMFINNGEVQLEDLTFIGCKKASALKIDGTSPTLGEQHVQNSNCPGHVCSVRIHRCRFENNFAAPTFDKWDSVSKLYGGGAIQAIGMAVIIDDCHFRQNVGSLGGAIYLVSNEHSSLDVLDSTFIANKADNGGAIMAYTSLHVYGSHFVDNEAKYGGAIIAYIMVGGVYNCVFTAGRAKVYGGAVHFESSNSIIKDCRFLLNTSDNRGGAVYVYNAEVFITQSEFIENEAKSSGGAVYADDNSQLLIADLSFFHNVAHGDPATNDIRYPPRVSQT